MVQIIDDPNRNPLSFKGLGQGVNTGLKMLLENKIAEHQRGKISSELRGMNIDPNTANFISRLPPDQQVKALQSYQGSQGGQGGQESPYPQHGGGMPQQQQQRQYSSPFASGASEAQLLARQKAINTSNSNYNKNLSKGIENATSALDALQNMKELLKTGKVSNGLRGKLTPGVLLNTESQLFDKYSNQLAQQLSGQSGIPTGFKIKFALTQKPNLEQNARTQSELTDKLIKDTEKILMKGEIRDMLIEENGGEQPSNLETLVNKRYKAYENNPYRFMAEQQEQQQAQEQSQGGFNPQQEQQPQQGGPGYDTSNESIVGTAARRALSGVARAGEAVLGTPGDIADTALSLGNYLTNDSLPQESGLPTSQSLQEATGRLTKGYTNPTSETEKSIDNIVSTAASLFLPTKIRAPFVKNLAKIINPKAAKIVGKVLMPFSGTTWQKSLKMGAAGELGARGAETLGGGPLAQGLSKVAFMSIAGTKGTRSALENAKQEAFDTRDEFIKGGINEGNVVPVTKTLRDVTAFKNRVLRSGSPDADLVASIAERVENGLKESNKIGKAAGFKNGAHIKDVLALDKNMNKWYEKASRPIVSGEQHLPKTARKDIAELGRILNTPIDNYGKLHPEFGFNHALGNELHAGLTAAENIADYFSGATFSSNPVSWALKSIGKGILIGGGQKAADFAALLKESPAARDAYKQALLGAYSGNADAANKAAKTLNDIALKLGFK